MMFILRSLDLAAIEREVNAIMQTFTATVPAS
jgi:hypothetical protein